MSKKDISLNYFNLLITLLLIGQFLSSQSLDNKRINGYKPIWFELNQKFDFGDKYSGALGTYTAKHRPIAIYAPVVNKTFFVYGGTKSSNSRHLLCMIGEFDHESGSVSKPVVVCDKLGVNDPHDNPSLLIDKNGFIWVFVSGRGRKRFGHKYKSVSPYNINKFEKLTEEEMTYPQPLLVETGLFNFFTKYTGVRELYFERTDKSGKWSNDILLASIPENNGEKSGHYQISAQYNGQKIGTFFNRHPKGVVDKRTDLYYIESNDFGDTWFTVDKKIVKIPLTDINSPSRLKNYSVLKKNIYLKDMLFDNDGNPICLYIKSNGHKPGPESAPYEWILSRWDGLNWITTKVTTSDHNYDMGSLWVDRNEFKVVAPVGDAPQNWGVGGEIEIWYSKNKGTTWIKERILTESSHYNHSYVRKVKGGQSPFNFLWADGHPHKFGKSQLWFGDFNGNVYRLPYKMNDDIEKPKKIVFGNRMTK